MHIQLSINAEGHRRIPLVILMNIPLHVEQREITIEVVFLPDLHQSHAKHLTAALGIAANRRLRQVHLPGNLLLRAEPEQSVETGEAVDGNQGPPLSDGPNLARVCWASRNDPEAGYRITMLLLLQQFWLIPFVSSSRCRPVPGPIDPGRCAYGALGSNRA